MAARVVEREPSARTIRGESSSRCGTLATPPSGRRRYVLHVRGEYMSDADSDLAEPADMNLGSVEAKAHATLRGRVRQPHARNALDQLRESLSRQRWHLPLAVLGVRSRHHGPRVLAGTRHHRVKTQPRSAASREGRGSRRESRARIVQLFGGPRSSRAPERHRGIQSGAARGLRRKIRRHGQGISHVHSRIGPANGAADRRPAWTVAHHHGELRFDDVGSAAWFEPSARGSSAASPNASWIS